MYAAATVLQGRFFQKQSSLLQFSVCLSCCCQRSRSKTRYSTTAFQKRIHFCTEDLSSCCQSRQHHSKLHLLFESRRYNWEEKELQQDQRGLPRLSPGVSSRYIQRGFDFVLSITGGGCHRILKPTIFFALSDRCSRIVVYHHKGDQTIKHFFSTYIHAFTY